MWNVHGIPQTTEAFLQPVEIEEPKDGENLVPDNLYEFWINLLWRH